ncbi:MAG: carbamoylsarcosine amidase [Ancylobacter novellus]|uniref:Carbamoylsarcosine amidase n=1 Tax=Ancylobacter novellus TaxID=921 RepID=A0A2W5T9L0_ANCNO|nr:MAG: carbamoylsarcosine amidase [Ancylobacter novellus]
MTENQDRIYERAGFGSAVARGVRPAVLVVDFTYGFTDPAYPTASDMSAAVLGTRRLIDAARAARCPVIFTIISYTDADIPFVPWLRKASGMAALKSGSRLVEIDDRLALRPDEPVISKHGASAFHGTDLAAMLSARGVDTLLVTGATTSGCVRASVVDAVQCGFGVLVVRECVADRAVAPHDANLFDIQQKYGDVIPLDDALSYVRSGSGLCGNNNFQEGV